MLVHSEIALGENEDTCYNVKNDEFSEKNRYEEYPVYLPWKHLPQPHGGVRDEGLGEEGRACFTVPYRVDGHAARQLTNQDYDKYDLLIGMDSANLQNMHRICGGDFAANCVVFSRRNLENLQWYSMTHGGNRKVAAFVVFGIL